MMDLAIQNVIGLLILGIGILSAPRLVGKPVEYAPLPQRPLSITAACFFTFIVFGVVYWIAFFSPAPGYNRW